MIRLMGQYLAWIIPRTRRLKFVQLKSLGSQEPLDQFQPNFVGNMHWGWGCRFVQIKGLASFGAE